MPTFVTKGPLTAPVNVSDGGTGATSLTDGGVLLGSGTGAVTALGVLTDGQIIVGDGTADPVALSAFSNSTGTLKVANGGTNISSYTAGDILYATGSTTLAKLGRGSDNQALTMNGTTIQWENFSSICFLKGTKITLSDKTYSNIEDLTLDDKVLTYNIEGLSELKDKNKISSWQTDKMIGSLSESGIRNIWINPTDSYLIINNKLRLTNHHLIHFKRKNIYYFNFAEKLLLGDELLTDEELYEPIISIEEVKDTINVYNFELDKDQTYFADNYLVHHYCKLCSGYANII
jgi:hypothetical protein